MAEKIFLVNPKVEYSSKETTEKIHKEQLEFSTRAWGKREQLADEAMHEECALKHVSGRVIIRINEESKNSHTFSNGMIIRRERKFNNFNFREVNPSNGTVISAENIPTGSEILFDYTSLHDSNKIFSYKSASPDVSYYSFKEDEIYAWRINKTDEWQPMKGCEFGLRVFKPYVGLMQNIPPTLEIDFLYITIGEHKDKIVKTLKGCDYQIVFTNENGTEGNLIRIRRFEDVALDEIVCVSGYHTDLLLKGELLIGLTADDAKKII